MSLRGDSSEAVGMLHVPEKRTFMIHKTPILLPEISFLERRHS
jgi:hypothetical protein